MAVFKDHGTDRRDKGAVFGVALAPRIRCCKLPYCSICLLSIWVRRGVRGAGSVGGRGPRGALLGGPFYGPQNTATLLQLSSFTMEKSDSSFRNSRSGPDKRCATLPTDHGLALLHHFAFCQPRGAGCRISRISALATMKKNFMVR